MEKNSYSPIPISWYFDQDIYQMEQELIFKHSPIYVGHELMVPKLHDYFVLERMNNAEMLMRNENSIDLISNICRHHQGIMLSGNGNTEKIICPLHHWTYDPEGTLKIAPRFPKNPCLNLLRQKLTNWHGILFQGENVPKELQLSSEVMSVIDFSGYEYTKSIQYTYQFNWKIFMEVFLDNYHVPSYHPGLRSFVNCNQQYWLINENYSTQFVKIQSHPENSPSPNYNKYAELLLKYNKNLLPEFGAIWLAYYPNIMIEYYPHMLCISTVKPDGPFQCINNVDLFHRKEIISGYPDFINAAQAAFEETVYEDAEIAYSMYKGKQALNKKQLDQSGPYHPELEKGMPSFYNFLRYRINPAILG